MKHFSSLTGWLADDCKSTLDVLPKQMEPTGSKMSQPYSDICRRVLKEAQVHQTHGQTFAQHGCHQRKEHGRHKVVQTGLAGCYAPTSPATLDIS